MENYYHKFMKQLIKDLFMILAYLLMSVGIVYWLYKLFTL